MSKKYIYFELNDWMPNQDYPDEEPYISLCTGARRGKGGSFYWEEPLLRRNGYCIKNRLSVVASLVDMSMNFCVITEKDWVKQNCPNLLTTYEDFLRPNGEDGNTPFRPINSPDDCGVHYYDFDNQEWIHENGD